MFPLSLAIQTRRGRRASWRVPAVVSWAGARGVLPLAAALSIPLTTNHAYQAARQRRLVLAADALRLAPEEDESRSRHMSGWEPREQRIAVLFKAD